MLDSWGLSLWTVLQGQTLKGPVRTNQRCCGHSSLSISLTTCETEQGPRILGLTRFADHDDLSWVFNQGGNML